MPTTNDPSGNDPSGNDHTHVDRADIAPADDQLPSTLPSETVRAIEAILMVADRPVEAHLLAQVTETAPDIIEGILRELAASYEVDGRGFILSNVAGGYRFQSHPDLAPYVERFVLEGQTARLSSAALETLAIVAYKQPLSRAQVAAIRGVNVDGVMRTLEQRGYVGEVGRDPGPGNPILFGTTDLFLERMGLGAIADLAPITTFMPGPEIVEALEHGLRADPDPDPAAIDPNEAIDPYEAIEPGGEPDPALDDTALDDTALDDAPLDDTPLDDNPLTAESPSEA